MLPLEKKLSISITDEKLFSRALTHSSKSAENYERLEFLGDSILDFLVGEFLFCHSQKDEGYLTVVRSHFVSENYLCQIFDEIGLSEFVKTGKSMGKKIPKAVKADIVEAIVAAIYLESGLEKTKKFVEEKLHLNDYEKVRDTNFKSKLQELVQAGFKCAMKYQTVKTDKGFTATFYMDEDKIASASGHDKQSAEQACAEKAIKILFKE